MTNPDASISDPGPGPCVVELRDVTRVYTMGEQQVHALAGVSLTIERGEFLAIMGSSGSGKSTMLNVLGCLDRPTSGTYLLEGQDVARFSDDELSDVRLAHLGFVFQNFNLIPQLTVQENIELPLNYQGVDAAESAARAAELRKKLERLP